MFQENFWNIHIRKHTFVTYIFILWAGTNPGSLLCEWHDLCICSRCTGEALPAWQVFEEVARLVFRHRGIKRRADSKHLTAYLKEIGKIFNSYNILTAMLSEICITPVSISSSQHSCTHVNLAINRFVCLWSAATSDPSDSLISSLSSYSEHPKLEIRH